MIAEFECYNAYGELMERLERKVVSSFNVDCSGAGREPYVLGIWVDVGPGKESGRSVVPVYLTQKQKEQLTFVTPVTSEGS
jgi:hypothetical protein